MRKRERVRDKRYVLDNSTNELGSIPAWRFDRAKLISNSNSSTSCLDLGTTTMLEIERSRFRA